MELRTSNNRVNLVELETLLLFHRCTCRLSILSDASDTPTESHNKSDNTAEHESLELCNEK